jgi:hypothetical protein
MTFQQAGSPHEAAAVVGDSGGAVFAKNGATWELAGTMVLRLMYTGQPANTILYGNKTIAIDLSDYKQDILAITHLPEPSQACQLMAGIFCIALLKKKGGS